MSNILAEQSELTPEQVDRLIAEELSYRRRYDQHPAEVALGLGGATLLGEISRGSTQRGLNTALVDEFQDIRENPERQAKQMDQMIRTYEKYLQQGNNPVEYFVPVKDDWAASKTTAGEDVVFYDPSAPHPAVMAHELGHVQMNHSNDPLSFLQTSGLGKLSSKHATALGALGAAAGAGLGARRGGLRNQAIGTAIGGAAGTVAGSGNFLYELGGASGRALGYLPEDVDKVDAAGDLTKAGLTYAMAGPVKAAVAAAAVGSAGLIAAHPDVRRKAGQLLSAYLMKEKAQ